MTVWGSGFSPVDALGATVGGPQVEVEVVSPNLRVHGTLSLGSFGRLSDRVNYSRGFVHLQDARVLDRAGGPTPLDIHELYVNQDEITFIAVSHVVPDDRQSTRANAERPVVHKQPRRYVVFTPGHSIAGQIHVHGEASLSTFVETSDPLFVPMTDVTALSLGDQPIESRFDLALVNRTQIIAVAEVALPSSEPNDRAPETG